MFSKWYIRTTKYCFFSRSSSMGLVAWNKRSFIQIDYPANIHALDQRRHKIGKICKIMSHQCCRPIYFPSLFDSMWTDGTWCVANRSNATSLQLQLKFANCLAYNRQSPVMTSATNRIYSSPPQPHPDKQRYRPRLPKATRLILVPSPYSSKNSRKCIHNVLTDPVKRATWSTVSNMSLRSSTNSPTTSSAL